MIRRPWARRVRSATSSVVAGVVLGGLLGLVVAAWPLRNAASTAGSTDNPVANAQATDQFWSRFMYVDPARPLSFHFDTLDALTDQADLVVRGRLTRLYVGEQWRFSEFEPTVPHVYATLDISEIVKGVPASRDPGSVEVMWAITDESFDPTTQPVPPDEHLWFLMHHATWWSSLGRTPTGSELEPFAYFRPNHHQAVFRNMNGAVDIVRDDFIADSYGEDEFPLALEGMGFEGFVGQVREQAAEPLAPAP